MERLQDNSKKQEQVNFKKLENEGIHTHDDINGRRSRYQLLLIQDMHKGKLP